MLRVRIFDGHTSREVNGELYVYQHGITLCNGSLQESFSIEEIKVTHLSASLPLVIDLPDGRRIEGGPNQNAQDASALLKSLGRHSLSRRRRVRRNAFVLIASGAVLLLLYTVIIPSSAKFIAVRIPYKTLQVISANTLLELDRETFHTSSLPESKKVHIETMAREMFGGITRFRILFRSSATVGANALAIPDGTIVLTDDLVTTMRSDDEIMAVIAHELGHVVERHGVQHLVEGSAVFGLGVALFGVNTFASGLSQQLIATSYSREAELEADRLGVQLLTNRRISPEALISALSLLEQSEQRKLNFTYLSTHPATHDRIQLLQNLSNNPTKISP